jgi:hypothetical protein
VARWLEGGGAGATVASLASEFDRHFVPSIRQARTRADYWKAWRLVRIGRLETFLVWLGRGAR